MVNKITCLLAALVYVLVIGAWQLQYSVPAAASSSNVVISEVSMETLNLSQEFIELYNNSPSDVSLDGWTMQIRSASGSITRTIALGKTLRGNSYALAVSTAHATLCVDADFTCFSGAMTPTGGHVVILNKAGVVVDALGWGTAVSPEGLVSPPPWLTVLSLNRKISTNTTLLDTDNNANDFSAQETSPQSGGVYTPSPPADPPIIPAPSPNCQGLSITEILPNPAGEDTGREYIELHNATDAPVELSGCKLKVGSAEQTLSGTISPGYLTVFGLTLPNSAGGEVQLVTTSATIVVNYPGGLTDDEAYGLVDGVWQRGLVPTPGTANAKQASIVEEESDEAASTACPAGKYRSPETNRCRNIATSASSLAPCEPGETRSVETNRCRKISATGTGPAPCQPGQERNPETNRCRKVAAAKTTNPMASPANAANRPVSYYVLGIVALLAVGYGIYEYRSSIKNIFLKRRLRNE